MIRSLLCATTLGAVFLLGSSCSGDRPAETGVVTIVFKHGRIAGDPAAFGAIVRNFEDQHPGIRIQDETLPSSSDDQHQFFAINLEAGSSDFDVLSMDVIWVPEFARAGWVRDLTHLLPPERRSEFFDGPISAATVDGHVYAIPWYVDAGLLYYRKDLLKRYGFDPPKTWDELIRIAEAVMKADPGIYGYVWQGKQYEGLVCNALEFIWSQGGKVLDDGRVVINSPENRRALALMHDLIHRYRVSPDFVTTSTEEPTRQVFENGQAVFLRNWPYAWTLFQREASPVRGKVGVSGLPVASGGESASTLGGWQLGINRHSVHPDEAETFLLYLTSPEAERRLALGLGYMPARRSLYTDPELLRARPFLGYLRDVFDHARPRPVTPYYMMISQVLQPEFSAVLAGTKTPDAALEEAAESISFLINDQGHDGGE